MKYFTITMILAISLSGLLISCNKKAKKDFTSIEKKLRDSLDQKYKPEEMTYVYYDSIPVYKDKSEKQLLEYIPFCEKVYLDTVIDPVVDMETIYYIGITYVKLGVVRKGVVKQPNLARQAVKSKIDSTLMFMCNYLEPKGDFCAAEIKAVRDKTVLTNFIPDDSLITGLYLDMFLVDNIALKDPGEVIYLSTYYPACGYAADDWFLGFKDNQFITLSHTTNWADAPYWANTTVYLPFKTNKGVVMASWSPYYTDTNHLVTDTNGTIITYQLPEEYLKDIDQMIYQESSRSNEMLDKNGNPILDENEEPMLGSELYEKRWFKWDGTKILEVKVDTTVVRLPD